MKPAARRYQTQITGVPEGQVYRVEGVRFDGFKDGVLLETKGPGYAKFLKKDGAPYEWFRGFKAMLEQAKRQLRVSGGTPIRWHFAEREAADYTRKLFNSNDIEDIEIVFTAVTH